VYKFGIRVGGEVVAMIFGARWGMGLGLAVLLTGTVWAQQKAGETEPATPAGEASSVTATPAPLPPSVPSDSLSPERLMAGPSLRETGRIAIAPTPMSTTIEGEGTTKSPTEKSIARAASTIAPTPVRPSGVIDQRVLDREIADRFAEIGGCRVEVARAKQVKPPEIVADRLLLRWTILPDGSTGSTDVVAIAPVDMGVMDCAKRTMSQWTFSRPRGGSMAVERRFSFVTNGPSEGR